MILHISLYLLSKYHLISAIPDWTEFGSSQVHAHKHVHDPADLLQVSSYSIIFTHGRDKRHQACHRRPDD
jgi:hypothetical protein